MRQEKSKKLKTEEVRVGGHTVYMRKKDGRADRRSKKGGREGWCINKV
jgi:hypothetical protein